MLVMLIPVVCPSTVTVCAEVTPASVPSRRVIKVAPLTTLFSTANSSFEVTINSNSPLLLIGILAKLLAAKVTATPSTVTLAISAASASAVSAPVTTDVPDSGSVVTV